MGDLQTNLFFSHLRTWLETGWEACEAGHCTMSTAASFYLALHIPRPSLIGVTAVKYL